MLPKIFRSPKFWLLVILAVAAFLRFYRLPEYLRFLGDEGRDVLVVKRMIVDHQWTLLGPTASVGGFYTGPIYYYFMIPFLWLFGLDPVGPAVMSALFGLATIVLIYSATKVLAGQRAGVIAATLAAISPKMVEISRFSWNPNPVPFFALATFLCLYLAFQHKRKMFLLLAGIFLGVIYQLHYTGVILFPIVGAVSFFLFPRSMIVLTWVILALGFLLGNAPFLVFELRHGFPNTQTVWEFVTRGTNVAPRSLNLFGLLEERIRILFEVMFGTTSGLIRFFVLGSLLTLIFWMRKNIKAGALLLSWLVLGALGIGFYRGQIYDHYFGYLFPLPFIFLGLTSDRLLKFRWGVPLVIIGLVILSYFSFQSLYLRTPPNNLLAQTKSVDEIVLNLANDQPYNFALIAPGNSDHAYRYFLEVWGRPPVVIENSQEDPGRKSVTNQLVVVCEQKDCEKNILGHPLWEVAGFGQAEITKTVEGPAGIKVLKLIHYRQNGQ